METTPTPPLNMDDIKESYWKHQDSQLLDRVMSSMGFGPSALAKRLNEMADDGWEESSCLRAIQRARRGETSMTPALRLVLQGLDRDWRRAEKAASEAVWEEWKVKILRTTSRDFEIALVPQRGNRWLVNLKHIQTGYSPSWIEWQDDLETAKIRAFVQLDDTWLDTQWQEHFPHVFQKSVQQAEGPAKA
ncbi:hypothetical protein ACTVH1_18730 [Gluconobacter cerinus]